MTNSEEFRVAIVGMGAIARVAHLPAVLASTQAELKAVVDPDIAGAKEVCKEYGLKVQIAPTVDALDVHIDGAIVATPNFLHLTTARALLEKDICVLVEKPLATDCLGAKELADFARERNLVLAVGFHTRQSGACRTLKHCVQSGLFGAVRYVSHQDGSVGGWAPVSGYNLNRQTAGGGVLVTTGTHFVDRMLWFFGFPSSLEFFDDSADGPEGHCVVRCAWEKSNNLINCQAVFSKVMPLPENTVVETDEGLLVMSADVAEYVDFHPHRDKKVRYRITQPGHAEDRRNLYQRQLEEFIAACRHGPAACVRGEEALESVRLVDALYKCRQPIELINAIRQRG